MKKIYKSKYTDKDITEAQLLVDKIFEKRAKKSGKTLPQQYWTLTPYKGSFMKELMLANKLLKTYSGLDILSALDGEFILSLKNPKLIVLIKKAQFLRLMEEKRIQGASIVAEQLLPRNEKKKEGLFDKL